MTGRVEVCVDGQWKTICSQRFNSMDATIVCRELGFSDKGSYIQIYIRGPKVLAKAARSKLIIRQWCSFSYP